jgi:integrase
LQVYHVFRKCLEDAKREGIVTFNVLDRVDAPPRAVNPRGSFTADQVKLILRHASSRHVAALLTGCRQSELLGLTWPCVDLAGPFPSIRVEWQLQELRQRHGCGNRGSDGVYPCGMKQAARCAEGRWQIPDGYEYHLIDGRLALVRPKTHHGYRAVPILPPLAAALRIEQTKPAGPHGLVWHEMGKPVTHKDDEAEWKALMVSVGMPGECTLHWARHSLATLLMESRVDTKVVGEIVGHGSTAVTKGYQHVTSQMARDGMQTMWELLA